MPRNFAAIFIAALVGLLQTPLSAAGVFYGLWWDGAVEQFVKIDPYTGNKTVLGVIPGVKYLNLSAGYVFDPDSSRYAFVGREANNQDYYYVIHAPTGDLVAKTPSTFSLNNMIYSPNDRKVYGLSWADSSIPAITDSLGHHPSVLRGQEYFVAIDPYTGAKTETPIPGVKYIVANSQFLDTDSGRYVFSGKEDGGATYYYVLDVATGSLLARVPVTISINNPVYNSALNAVHGLWWSDSSHYSSYDSLGRPIGVKVLQGTEYFVTLHADSTVTTVELPEVKYIASFNHTFDSDSGRYVFIGMATPSTKYYYVVEAATGAVLSKTPVNETINSIAYSPYSSTFDPAYSTTPIEPPLLAKNKSDVKVYRGYVMMRAEGANPTIVWSDLSGRRLIHASGNRDGLTRVDTRSLKTGIYLYEVRDGLTVMGTGKIWIP